MALSTLDLKNIAASGGGMILTANDFSTLDLKHIAASGKGCVVFDFT